MDETIKIQIKKEMTPKLNEFVNSMKTEVKSFMDEMKKQSMRSVLEAISKIHEEIASIKLLASSGGFAAKQLSVEDIDDMIQKNEICEVIMLVYESQNYELITYTINQLEAIDIDLFEIPCGVLMSLAFFVC